MHIGGQTLSRKDEPPFGVGHVNAPSWRMSHVSIPPSWIWARWWAGHALQVMCCMGIAPIGFYVQLVSDRDGSGPEGHELVSNGESSGSVESCKGSKRL